MRRDALECHGEDACYKRAGHETEEIADDRSPVPLANAVQMTAKTMIAPSRCVAAP
jgi:hypothetical protein